jgi:phage terminase large subunit-like protein
VAPKSPWEHAADIFDPPQWEPDIHTELQPHQQPPPGIPGVDWKLWLLEAGRGAGKTEACAQYYTRHMRMNPMERGRIIAPTFGDAVEACIEGPSGILSLDPEVKWEPNAPGGARLTWPGGSRALVIGTNAPRDVDRLRAGGNRGIDWWEEMAANPQLKDAWDQAAFGLRLGKRPHSIASTTPRNTKDYRAIREMEFVKLVKASLFDNKHLPKSFVEMMIKKYEGTRLGRQELRGELLDDIEGALWIRSLIEANRIAREKSLLPDMVEIVVAIDPAATSNEESDDTGIIVVGLGSDGYGYVLEDLTCHLPPDGWGTRAVRAYYRWQADRIVGEINNGGEMVEYVISAIDPHVPFKRVRASRGKETRAQPVSALYGDGRNRESLIKHWGEFPDLEDQMTTWVPGEGDESPDNMDALVWAITDIFLEENEEDQIVEEWVPVEIGIDV